MDVVDLVISNEVCGLIKLDEIAHPSEQCDVGDRVIVAHDPLTAVQPGIEHLEQPLRLLGVPLERSLVLPFAAGEFVEKTDLAEHWPHMADLPHYPLDGLVPAITAG